jgi:hypothetical protein
MRKRILAAGGLIATALLLAAAQDERPRVTVRAVTAKVMPRADFVGTALATVYRGEELVALDEKADKRGWRRVESKKGVGFIHAQFLGKPEGPIKLSGAATTNAGGATSNEVELAGRGFSREIEHEYKGAHPDFCFPRIDQIEAAHFDDATLTSFAEEGQLGAGGGGRP